MKQAARILAIGVAALTSGAIAIAASPIDQGPQVVGHALTKLELPGKISAVLWTRRKDYFTLQITRRLAPELGRVRGVAPSPSESPSIDSVQVWLLRADGSHVSPLRRWETPDEKKQDCTIVTRCLGYEIQYLFPLSDGEAAVAVAMSFGDEYLIEKLPTLR